MMRILPKATLGLAIFSTLLTHQINAYCSRCAEIEEERAKDQAEHPQPVGYYDEMSSRSIPPPKPPVLKDEKTRVLNESAPQLSSPTKETSSQPSETSKQTNPMFKVGEKTENFFSGVLASNAVIQTSTILQDKDLSSSNDSNSDQINSNSRDQLLFNQTYSTLYTILKTKNFLETLDGSFTLFVPNNEALSQLPQGMLNDLTKPENQEKLAALISNHVFDKQLLRKDFETYNNHDIKTISGKNLTLRIKNGKLSVNGAQVLRVEYAGYDGIIYIIDKVFLP